MSRKPSICLSVTALVATMVAGAVLLAMLLKAAVVGEALGAPGSAWRVPALTFGLVAALAGLRIAWRRLMSCIHEPGDDDDSGGGGSGPDAPIGPEPEPEPAWWPQFERDLRAYVRERERTEARDRRLQV